MVAEPGEEKKWTIFLSHSSKDKKPFIDWLYGKLCSADLIVWYDKYEILVGDSIIQKIAEGLNGSEFLIVVISRWAVKSNWVKEELEPRILEQIEGQKVTVLPIALGKIKPGEISPFLKGKRYIRFPHKGSDEKFRELLENIKQHLIRRGLLNAPRMTAVQTALQNPFGLRGGIEPERFVVPERLVREITEDIAKKQTVSIVGARMMGKTSLLKFLVSERCKPYYRDDSGQSPELRFAYIDLQEHSGKSRNELVPELACVISESLSAEKRFQGNTHSEALNWLKQTTGRRRTESPFWVLLFDEFDRIVELSGIDKTFFDELRSLPQHYNLCYVIASRRKLIDLPLPQGASTSPFFNFLIEHFLTVWDKPTTRTLMFKPRGTKLGLFTEDDFAFISQLTAHHPLLLQIGCYHLFNTRHEDEIDYDEVCNRYMQEAEGVYRYYWKEEINDVERGWLSDCWYALSRKDTATLQELQKNTIQRMNCTIYLRLEELGFILSESGNIELPTGFQSFLEMNPIPLTNLEALLCELNNIQERIRSDYGQFLTVLFTDIEGFTTWTQQFGDVASAARVQKHNDLLFPVVESHQGEVLKTIGDALLAVFEDAEKAVSAASKMQDILEKYNREEIEKSQRILIRCGLHTGDVMRFKRDVFGDTVNIAARIVSLASGGEIMMSAATYEKIKDRFGVLCAESGEYELKGIDDKVKVYKLQIGMAKIT